jgi:hypothetical protein
MARAVCIAAMSALASLGGEYVIVYPRGDLAYPIPNRMYRGPGFHSLRSNSDLRDTINIKKVYLAFPVT